MVRTAKEKERDIGRLWCCACALFLPGVVVIAITTMTLTNESAAVISTNEVTETCLVTERNHSTLSTEEARLCNGTGLNLTVTDIWVVPPWGSDQVQLLCFDLNPDFCNVTDGCHGYISDNLTLFHDVLPNERIPCDNRNDEPFYFNSTAQAHNFGSTSATWSWVFFVVACVMVFFAALLASALLCRRFGPELQHYAQLMRPPVEGAQPLGSVPDGTEDMLTEDVEEEEAEEAEVAEPSDQKELKEGKSVSL